MFARDADCQRGLTALRLALLHVLDPSPELAGGVACGATGGMADGMAGGVAARPSWLMSEAIDFNHPKTAPAAGRSQTPTWLARPRQTRPRARG